MNLLIRWAEWRFGRKAAQQYSHMVLRHRLWPCGRVCWRCAGHFLSGGRHRELTRTRQRMAAFKATESWWPLGEKRRLPSGNTYRTRVAPYEYEDYQAWLNERTAK